MTEASRVELVQTTAARLPELLGSIARAFIADRRLAPDDRVAVQLGFAADDNTAKAMERGARAVIEPVGERLRLWLTERTIIDPCPSTTPHLHADFCKWARAAGEPLMELTVFARRLRGLGVRARLHPRTRRSEFYIRLLCANDDGDVPE